MVAKCSRNRTAMASSKDKAPSFATYASVLSPLLLRSLAQQGFTHPTAVQSAVLTPALASKDVLARSRTGSGKTLAYGIPALQRILTCKSNLSPTALNLNAVRTLVLVPTRELSEQVTSHLKALCDGLGDATSIRVVNIAGGASSSHKERKGNAGDRIHKFVGTVFISFKRWLIYAVFANRLQLADGPDIVVATPSRALQHLRNKSLDLSLLECLIIDEADLILSYGHSSDDIRSILNGPWVLPVSYQSFLMSATITGEVEELQGVVLRDPVRSMPFFVH